MTMSGPAARLDALTSLRFFAAAAIAFGHSCGIFGLSVEPFNFSEAVSFFFVLSGFILAWVYPSLASGQERGQFWVARVARIWPAHFATLLLTFVLFSSSQRYLHENLEWWMLPANLLMIHTWIPYKACAYHYNTPSWSISTEAFFYLVFPWLIVGLRRNWWIKLLLSAALAFSMIILCNVAHIPDGVEPLMNGVSAHVVIYHLPLTRLFEFVIGMCAALLFRYLQPRVKIGAVSGTLVELAALALVITLMFYSGRIASSSQAKFPSIGEPGVLWMHQGGLCCLFFGLLILVFALNRGLVSRALSLPFLVLLGEISYALYLFHFSVIHYYMLHEHVFGWIPRWWKFGMFWGIFLLGSYLLWKYIEKPCREMIRAWVGKERRTPGQPILPSFSWRMAALEFSIFLALLLPVILSVHPLRR